MKGLVFGALMVLSSGTARAETFTYDCKTRGISFPLTVDDACNELLWRGKTYRIRVQESCTKYGWRAQRRGEAFDFCTATKGYADFELNGSVVRCAQRVSVIPEEYRGRWAQVPEKDEKCDPGANPFEATATNVETNGGETSCEVTDTKQIRSPVGPRLEITCFLSGEGTNGVQRSETWRIVEMFGKRVLVDQARGEVTFWQRYP